MRHFQEILTTLGASSIELVENNEHWEFYHAGFKTPFAFINGSYLYLKSGCPAKEATNENVQRWKVLSQNHGSAYDVIITQASALAQNLEQTKLQFGARFAKTSRQLLQENFLKGLSSRYVDQSEYYIDPHLELANGDSVPYATRYLSQWLKGVTPARTTLAVSAPKDSGSSSPDLTSSNAQLAIILAHGGVGKTTVARSLSRSLSTASTEVIPLLIESDQWKQLAHTSPSLNSIWDMALSRRFERAGSLIANRTALRVLIREGLFVVIFDGFDELCVAPGSPYSPKTLIDELVQLVSSNDLNDSRKVRILLTARETYWNAISEDIDSTSIEVFHLRGFDNEQRKQYFRSRLQNTEEIDLALRLSKQISGGIYGNVKQESLNEDRLSGIPFVLDLVARYVHGNDTTPNPYASDPFYGLLQDVCRRENRRQTLNLSPEQQFAIFEELFREHPQSFSFDVLKLYVEVLGSVSDLAVIHRFANHMFLERESKDILMPRYEVLRVYFLARFLAVELSKALAGKTRQLEIARTLADNKSGNTQVIDWLVHQLEKSPDNLLSVAFEHALDIASNCEPELRKAALMALFHVGSKLISNKVTQSAQEKRERTAMLAALFSKKAQHSSRQVFKGIVLTGLIKSYDFSNADFIDCHIANASFKNCLFASSTKFINCTFDGILEFLNCEEEHEIEFQIQSDSMSKEAEFAIAKLKNSGIRNDVKRSLADEALTRALSKFRGEFGFSGIQYRHRLSGFKAGNPYTRTIWDVLEKHKIVEKHLISNVVEGGLHLRDDKELRREITSFFDNGVPGPALAAVILELVAD